MRSCDRDASLARALIKVLMTLGAGQTVPVGGADEVISNSTASSASKQEVMRLTEQRESHDTERYSPSTHTWETNKLSAVSASGFEQMLKCEKHWVFAHNPRYTEESALSLPHVYRVPLCCRRWLCFQQTPAARGTGSRPERGGAYIASTGGSWTPCRNSEKWLERVSGGIWRWEWGSQQRFSVSVYRCISLMYAGMLRSRLLLSSITRIKWAKSFSSAIWKRRATYFFNNVYIVNCNTASTDATNL